MAKWFFCLAVALSSHLAISTDPPLPPIAGGVTAADVNSQGVQDAAAAGVTLLNARSNSMYALQHTRIVSATQQVVAGMKYVITLHAGLTACRNDGASHTLLSCPVPQGALKEYTITVLDQPWHSPRFTLVAHSGPVTITATAKKTKTEKTPCVGCTKERAIDAQAMAAARAGMALVNDKATFRHQLITVISAKHQTVSGILYTLVVRAGPSSCIAHEDAKLETSRMNAWILQHNGTLNQYGDSVSTMYPGGSPLFDERTGQRLSREHYMLKKHTTRPWCTVAPEDVYPYTLRVSEQAWRTPRYTLLSSTLPSTGMVPMAMVPAPQLIKACATANKEQAAAPPTHKSKHPSSALQSKLSTTTTPPVHTHHHLGLAEHAGYAMIALAGIVIAVVAVAFVVHRWRAWRVSTHGLQAMQQHQIVQEEIPVVVEDDEEKESKGLVLGHARATTAVV